MRNGGLTGTTQITATFTKMARPYEIVVGSIGDEEPYREIARRCRVHDCVTRLRHLEIGMLGHGFPGMYDLEMDRTRMLGALGPNVVSVALDQFLDHWQKVSDRETRSIAETLAARFRVRGPGPADLASSVRVGIAMERLIESLGIDALCFLGQDYVEKAVRAPARLGASLILEKGRHLVSCEGDLMGLVAMHLLYWLTCNPPVQAEWAQYDTSHNALLLVGHGIASPALAGTDDRVTLTESPEAWGSEGVGVNLQFILKPGRATMTSLLETAQGYQMLISGGECLDYPCLPCKEIHALVRVERPAKEYLVEIQRRGVPHHVFVAYGDARRELELLASCLGIQTFTL
jgi:L-arabinose isomerase